MLEELQAVLYYDIDLSTARTERVVSVSVASGLSGQTGYSPLRTYVWRCALPDPNKYLEESFGTSEVKGIIGGIKQSFLAAQSELIERALGDALTVAFTHALDKVPDVRAVFVRGPAFPKTVGRFLSLKPPVDLEIAWVTGLGQQHDSRHPTSLLFPLNWFGNRSMAWDHEGLINSFTYPSETPQWAVEFLERDQIVSKVSSITNLLDTVRTVDALPPAVELTKRLLLASDTNGPKHFEFDAFKADVGPFEQTLLDSQLVQKPGPNSMAAKQRIVWPWLRH